MDNIYAYRMTHIDNIPHILEYGITMRFSANANPQYRAIGDTRLIETRNSRLVTTSDGKQICIGGCIPFYFGVRMPMLYVIQKGGNFVKEAVPPTDIVYLVVCLNDLLAASIPFYFSNGHAVDYLSTVFPSERAEEIPGLIDWDAVKAHKWSGEGVEPDLKRRKQAELLVQSDIPSTFICSIVCHDYKAKKRLEIMSKGNISLIVSPNAYY